MSGHRRSRRASLSRPKPRTVSPLSKGHTSRTVAIQQRKELQLVYLIRKKCRRTFSHHSPPLVPQFFTYRRLRRFRQKGGSSRVILPDEAPVRRAKIGTKIRRCHRDSPWRRRSIEAAVSSDFFGTRLPQTATTSPAARTGEEGRDARMTPCRTPPTDASALARSHGLHRIVHAGESSARRRARRCRPPTCRAGRPRGARSRPPICWRGCVTKRSARRVAAVQHLAQALPVVGRAPAASPVPTGCAGQPQHRRPRDPRDRPRGGLVCPVLDLGARRGQPQIGSPPTPPTDGSRARVEGPGVPSVLVTHRLRVLGPQ